ncbi:hypothetical protein GCM10009841_21960 [Microlunatus panaciterrae]|uniref:Uncharacterized protein n=1 Tax=Microlunatus panaciterrae TaxID=400768 RepID=A0ABS2REY9_9ACTN|nr:hypothetical protein [Microlunatus panaciterrae]MBM7797082.1 hypothetical protein [Microlunatus panaciterrae]
MTGTAKVLRWIAFVLMTLFGLLGGLFVAGYAFEDLDIWTAIGSTAAWAVPMIALSAFALWRPDPAVPVFVGLTAIVGVLTLLNTGFRLINTNVVGPVAAIGVFALAVSLGFLGLHRASMAGLLMVLLALAQFGATVLGFAGELSGGEGPSLANMLTTSSGVVVVPTLVVGTIFLVAGGLGHDSFKFWRLTTPHPAH